MNTPAWTEGQPTAHAHPAASAQAAATAPATTTGEDLEVAHGQGQADLPPQWLP